MSSALRPGEHLVPQGGPPVPSRPDERLIEPGQQLAEGRPWQENYLAALQADLPWRTQREEDSPDRQEQDMTVCDMSSELPPVSRSAGYLSASRWARR
jgi:hypothetical protein